MNNDLNTITSPESLSNLIALWQGEADEFNADPAHADLIAEYGEATRKAPVMAIAPITTSTRRAMESVHVGCTAIPWRSWRTSTPPCTVMLTSTRPRRLPVRQRASVG